MCSVIGKVCCEQVCVFLLSFLNLCQYNLGKKGPSKKLLHCWFGPYRIVEQSSPVNCRFCTETNKNVAFAVDANRMKPYYNPDLRPIDPPFVDDPNEPYLEELDIPED